MSGYSVGDTVHYCGHRYWEQYGNLPLVLLVSRAGEWTAKKPDVHYTTNLLASEFSRSPVDQPRSKVNRPTRKGRWIKELESEQKEGFDD
jgi:hypothetical protein